MESRAQLGLKLNKDIFNKKKDSAEQLVLAVPAI